MRRPLYLRPAAAVFAALAALLLSACGKGQLITGGPLPTPTPVVPNVSNEFTLPTAAAGPMGITANTDGYLYIAEAAANKIAQMTTGGTFTELTPPTANSTPYDVTALSGTLYFTEETGNNIGALAGGQFTEYPIPTANAGPTYLVRGPNGSIWFSESTANKIGVLSAAGTIVDYALPIPNAGVSGLVFPPNDVTGLWIVEKNASALVRFDTNARTFGPQHPTLTPNAGPLQVVPCPDNQSICFTENTAAKLGRLFVNSGVMQEYSLSPATSATALVLGPDFNLYFADPAQNKFGRISGVNFTVGEFPITTAGSNPMFMAVGPDARIYFTENAANKIGQISYF